MNINLRVLKAKWTLGWALVKHVVLMPVTRTRGPGAWLQRIGEEDLTATPAGTWDYVEQTSRCIGCGLCDLVAPAGESPSAWIMGAARRPQDADLSRAVAPQLRELAESISAICPTRLSADALAQLIEESAARLDELESEVG